MLWHERPFIHCRGVWLLVAETLLLLGLSGGRYNNQLQKLSFRREQQWFHRAMHPTQAVVKPNCSVSPHKITANLGAGTKQFVLALLNSCHAL